MRRFSKALTVFAVLGALASPVLSRAHAAGTDPAILAAVDAAIGAINSGSLADAKAAYADAPAAITDDFPPFYWSGKSAVEDYSRDFKAILTK